MTADLATAQRRAATLAWLGIFGGALAAILALHAIGGHPRYSVAWSDLWRWLDGPPDRVLLALGRIVALLLAYYIAGSILLYTAARLTRIPTLIRSMGWATHPALRRIAERAVAVSLTVSTVAGTGVAPALAQSEGGVVPTPVVQYTDEGDSIAVPPPFLVADPGYADESGQPVPTPTSPDGEDDARVVVPPPLLPAAGSDDPAAVAVPSRRLHPSSADRIEATAATTGTKSTAIAYDYVVAKADNMWVIAERHLADVMGRQPTDAETATYWSHMIEVNRPLIRSGDPDLIFPGEIIVCPAVNESGL